MNKKSLVLKLVLALLVVIYCLLRSLEGGDFDVFLDAATKLSHHQNIYRPPFIKDLQYYYSPFFALLLVPFSYLPYAVTEFVWLLLSTLLLYRSWILITNYLDTRVLNTKDNRLWIFLTLFLTIRFLLYNYSMIQMTIFLIWATLESLALFARKKWMLGGLLLGFACTTKLLPLIFLPYLLYRGQYAGLVSTLSFFVFFLVLPILFIGYDFNTLLLHEWWLVINPGNAENSIEADIGTHSLVSLIPVYLTETHNKIDIKRNFINLTADQAVFITNCVRLVFVAATLFFLRSLPFKKNRDQVQTLWECSYLFLVTPLLFPHQQKYAFLYIAPALIYLLYYLIVAFKANSKNKILLAVLFSLTALIFTPFISSDLLGRYTYDVLQHFRGLTIATILLSLILAACTPPKLIAYVQALRISTPKPVLS